MPHPLPPIGIVIETRKCQLTWKEFCITNRDLELLGAISPTIGGKKHQIPLPTLCPEARQQRRLAWRNERKLYKRKCDATGKDIVSVYSPDKPCKVYNQDFWRSDAWDALSYGAHYDLTKTLAQNMSPLLASVPRCALINIGSENSEYTNICAYNKNSYLLVESSNNEDAIHSYWLQSSRSCVDCLYSTDCDRCYASDHLDRCYQVLYSSQSMDCRESAYLLNCRSCSNCTACVGLENTQYALYNVIYSDRESYERELEKLPNIHDQTLRSQAHAFWREHTKDADHIIQSEQAIGKNIRLSSHIFSGEECVEAESARYARHAFRRVSTVMDVDTVGYESERIYESINTAIQSSGNAFCIRCWSVRDSLYSIDCDASSHLFACIGIKNKEYCILNKQYTKEEYEAMVPQIIEKMIIDAEWWEFLSAEMSPFGYNETKAMELFPLSEEEVQKQGFQWSSYEAPLPQVTQVIPGEKLPQSIEGVPDDVLNWAIKCETSGRPFRIVPLELKFYRALGIPLPRKHPDVRYSEQQVVCDLF